ncbi:Transporter mfs1 [Escovopsis weberi]|uniref:Transporter mfs1 n=1 Tax=Escovopsis weberi TaxID=150374 RepID=A0A0M8MYJ5_ESCWE|nr:Transporter mfs1 [Escovopsis weberi]
MTMADVMRDTPVGFIIRWLSGRRFLKYPDEEPGFTLPDTWLQLINEDHKGAGKSISSQTDSTANDLSNKTHKSRESVGSNGATDMEKKISATDGPHDDGSKDPEAANPSPAHQASPEPIVPKVTPDGIILVDWYHEADPENPHKWSNGRRAGVTAIIFFYTFVVYTTSAIYTASEAGVMERFGVNPTKASLGLSIYVLGYGIGPLLFSPLSEIPRIGRNVIYIVTMFLFVILSIPTALANNYPGLMVLRFLTAFFGSPCLASGGATIGDIFSFASVPAMMLIWTAAPFMGPALGPLLSGFAVPAETWRWSLYISIWVSAPVLIAMFLFLPETSADNILLRRAQRLRRLTGSQRLMSQGEIRQKEFKTVHIFADALIKPLEITFKDPAIFFVQLYTGIIYIFESFVIVYINEHGMNFGQLGLVFLCIAVATFLAVFVYMLYLARYLGPRIMKHGVPVQEAWLLPSLPASFGPTIGLFIFAWTAKQSIHWIAPTIGITVYAFSAFILMQCVFVYVPLSYPQYAASLFAANDFVRSSFACGSVLYASPLFKNLGIGRGTSLLGGLSVLGEIGIFALFFYGARLRARSKFAVS